jgi:hypothetical protein
MQPEKNSPVVSPNETRASSGLLEIITMTFASLELRTAQKALLHFLSEFIAPGSDFVVTSLLKLLPANQLTERQR